jgi:hypothetical protein
VLVGGIGRLPLANAAVVEAAFLPGGGGEPVAFVRTEGGIPGDLQRLVQVEQGLVDLIVNRR